MFEQVDSQNQIRAFKQPAMLEFRLWPLNTKMSPAFLAFCSHKAHLNKSAELQKQSRN